MSLSIVYYETIQDISWKPYQAEAGLLDSGTHVWLIKVPDHPSLLSGSVSILTDEEQARAARYRKEADRNRFILGRIKLRQLLGERLQCAPQKVPICITKHKKPVIAG